MVVGSPEVSTTAASRGCWLQSFCFPSVQMKVGPSNFFPAGLFLNPIPRPCRAVLHIARLYCTALFQASKYLFLSRGVPLVPLDNPAMQHATGGHHGNMYLTSLPLVSVSPLQLVTQQCCVTSCTGGVPCITATFLLHERRRRFYFFQQCCCYSLHSGNTLT